jgi:tetratricopeptide (TPR) repeat protein
MIKKYFHKYSLLLPGLILIISSYAQDSTLVLWNKANELYVSENYQEAVDTYTQIMDSGLESAKLYFNLGNAYYKTGDISNAILNYERAKILAPQDKDIAFNLSLARQFVVTDIEELPQPFFVRWRNRILNLYPADTWSKISIGAFILFLLLLGFFLFSRNIPVRRLTFWFGILAVIVSGLSFSFAASQKKKITERNHAIVFCPRVTVKSAPSETGTDLFLLYEGVKVEISDSLNTWKEIRLSDGNVGWLPDSCIIRI